MTKLFRPHDQINLFRFHDQTTFSDPEAGTHGDCCRACVATLLQIDPAILPHPIKTEGVWNMEFHRVLREMGYAIRSVTYNPDMTPDCVIQDVNWSGFIVPDLVMAAGPSPRGPWLHAVVWHRPAHAMVHDPHPSRAGLTRIESFDYLAPYPAPES